jgi:Phospholipase_D-nuclease N-terminal
MAWRLVKTTYFATVCLPPPLLIVVYPMIFLRRLQVPSWFFSAIAVYFWLGALLVLIDLWRSRRQQDTKILWTVLLVILGIVTFPIYWFRFVLRDYQRV